MESENDYNAIIEKSDDENIILIKELVDYYIHKFGEYSIKYYDLNKRNNVIIKSYELIRKKYLCGPNARWEVNKKSMVRQIVKSYLITELVKSKKK